MKALGRVRLLEMIVGSHLGLGKDSEEGEE